MIKFTAPMQTGGTLYGFGLTEANLNRMQFNNEPIFFDFGYAGHPHLFGLVPFMSELSEPAEVPQRMDVVMRYCTPFLDTDRGVIVRTLRVFPIVQSVMQTFRNKPFWGFETYIEITDPKDMQLFFAGRDEQDIEKYLQDAGLIDKSTKRTYKGFGKRDA